MWNKLARILVLFIIAASLTTAVFAAVDEAEDTATAPARSGGEGEAAAVSEEEEGLPPGTELPCVRLSLRSGGQRHSAYVNGYEDRTFRPDATITRAEAAQLLSGLLTPVEVPALAYGDMAETDWYYKAVNTLVCGGVLDFDSGYLRPGENMTRGEFVTMLSSFAPEAEGGPVFSDVDADSDYYEAITKAAAAGWINGYGDGSFRPDRTLSRAEAVTVINRMLSRAADTGYTHALILPPFDDVTISDWAYDQILEASMGHGLDSSTVTETGKRIESWTEVDERLLARAPGLYFIGVELYYIGDDGLPVADATVDGLYYGDDGRYTSGNAELDGLVKGAMSGFIKSSMTRLEKLRAAYNYTRDSFSYLKRNYYAMGDNSYTEAEALTMLKTKRGNCYCYAGVFYYMSRQLGYDGTAVSGTVGSTRSPHGWVEIDFDGTTYIFDTELEMAYRQKRIYYYDFYMMSYARIPWAYEK